MLSAFLNFRNLKIINFKKHKMENLGYFKQYIKPDDKEVNSSKEVWIYTRVSSKEQFDNNNSVERQEREARLYATKNNFQVSKVFGSTYESAKKDFTRKEFMKMIDEVRKVKVKPYAILIFKISRFSRSGGGAVGLVTELVDSLKVQLIEVCSGVDTSTESGKLTVYNSLLAAYKENLDRKEITYGGMKDFIKKGNRLGTAPMGYDHYGMRVKDIKFFAPAQKLVINEEGKALKKAWFWKAEERINDAEIIRRLDSQFGIKLRAQKLSKIWRNPFYCGVNVSRLTEGEPVKGNWETMISVDTFKKVQDLLNEKPKQAKHLKDHPDRPLVGFLICGECQEKMTGYENKKKKIRYYKCQKCNGVSINAEKTKKALNDGAHELFYKLLSQNSLNPELFEPLKLQFKKYYEYVTKDESKRLENISKRIKEKEADLYDLMKNRALGKMKESEEFYQKLKTELEKEIVDLQMEMGNTHGKISNLDYMLDKSLNMLSNINKTWYSSDTATKKTIQYLLFPEGLKYDYKNRQYLTSKKNEYFDLVSSFSSNYEENKKGNFPFLMENSLVVARSGVEPETSGL